MNIQPFTAMLIIAGAHLSENLLHHNLSDVRRILEDKGFEEIKDATADPLQHLFAQPGTKPSAKRTVVIFGAHSQVLDENGVQFYDEPEVAGAGA